MIHSLRLSNFKIFKDLTLPLAPLTLLAGINSGGKSTIMQSLILLKQSLNQHFWHGELLVHGSEMSLGTVNDVLCEFASSKEISIGISGEYVSRESYVTLDFDASKRDAYACSLNRVKINGFARNQFKEDGKLGRRIDDFLINNEWQYSPLSVIKDLCWLGAERIGPREIHPLLDRSEYKSVGGSGEHAAGMLYWYGEDHVIDELRINTEPPTLLRQVQARMAEFFPGVEIDVKKLDHVQATTLRFRSRKSGDFHYSQNVGFGITQLFPLIVALLSAKSGDLLLIENPEVHLHPKAQQKIATFAAHVAAITGCQIIMETHSDHVLNGIRLAVKKGIISYDKIAFHWFGESEQDSSKPHIQSPQIGPDGRLDNWPVGFFDQIDNALQELI
ncbi:MAG: DUF3696 domain-containing protein [Candidatus Symbiobacter sp.]|nr:DUF3696 domain-containing protein [Candidatus Symbiobacter sp.]